MSLIQIKLNYPILKGAGAKGENVFYIQQLKNSSQLMTAASRIKFFNYYNYNIRSFLSFP